MARVLHTGYSEQDRGKMRNESLPFKKSESRDLVEGRKAHRLKPKFSS